LARRYLRKTSGCFKFTTS